jgi:hypothetical protein
MKKIMKTLRGYNVQIWTGLKERDTNIGHTIDEVRIICDKWVNEIGDCVSITPTEFRYTNGSEFGVVIGYINYPRFPRTRKEIRRRALLLAENLMIQLGQYKVTVTTPFKSYMLENYGFKG